MNAVLSMFESEAPMPDTPVELIPPRLKASWAWHAWTILLSVLTVIVVPEAVLGKRGLEQCSQWLHQTVDSGAWGILKLLVPFAGIFVASLIVHELTHFAAARLLGKVRARFSVYRGNPAVFFYDSLSRNHAIATALLPCILWGILPLLALPHFSPLHALILYIPVSQNLAGSRFDIAQAFYMARCLPAEARVYCHPEGLAYALPQAR
jgi:hypothetical protein